MHLSLYDNLEDTMENQLFRASRDARDQVSVTNPSEAIAEVNSDLQAVLSWTNICIWVQCQSLQMLGNYYGQ